MLSCIFTIDYEIYGNGHGDLRTLVVEPTRRLKALFDRADTKFVNFVEVSELRQIERYAADPALPDVRRQVRELHEQGHEIALHLHPQWANARFYSGAWELDYAEYNLCVLPAERIAHIVDDALDWLRDVLGDPHFTPLSFRAGNWLFQPTVRAASVLAQRGIKVDSSVFKGGRQRHHGLDYRAALHNGWHWRFRDDVNVPEADGHMAELPIYTQMIPFWRMLKGKRVGLQQRGYGAVAQVVSKAQRFPRGLTRMMDFCRPRYPLKFDFCRMTFAELTAMMESVVREDRRTPGVYKPLVAIGHTKDLMDFDTVAAFLTWLKERSIPVTTLADAYSRCRPVSAAPTSPVRGFVSGPLSVASSPIVP